MALDQKELGQRLRRAREDSAMTQEDVARDLKLSRSTVAQIELGNRLVSGIELSRLAFLFGRELDSLVSDDAPADEDALVALFRHHPELATQEDVREALRRCVALGQELTGLERLLDIDRGVPTVATYPLPQPRTKWDAIQQGERVAHEERGRLGLGLASLPDIVELLERQEVRTAQVALPEDISGLTLIAPTVGFLIVANREHHVLRRRFSYAHEYCHVLVDSSQQGLISRSQDRGNLCEVRANAFAASFLMPTEAVRQFSHASGKGRPSRMEAQVFDEGAPVRARARAKPGSQQIQLYDVVRMAHHFRVSRAAACYRLRSTRLLTAQELDLLLRQERAEYGRKLERILGIPEPDHQALRNQFRNRFVGLALEALRRQEISRAKLVEIAAMVEVGRGEVDQAVSDLGLECDDVLDVQLAGSGG